MQYQKICELKAKLYMLRFNLDKIQDQIRETERQLKEVENFEQNKE